MNFNKTINIFIFDGDPNGRIMCELSNWNGRVYKISRAELNRFSERSDSENTGVYFLFGKIDNVETIYIGESERIFTRLKQHLRDEVYWTYCVVVVSKDNFLNKAHVKFLEHKFYSLANKSNRFKITNNNVPTCSSISEYDAAILEEFISNAKLLVNTLGYKAFETLDDVEIDSNVEDGRLFIKSSRGANAIGKVVADGFAVLKDSVVADYTVPSIPKNIADLRSQLFENGTIGSNNTFLKDYVFSSPSYAASVVMGRSANGKSEWKNRNGETLNDIEQESVQ